MAELPISTCWRVSVGIATPQFRSCISRCSCQKSAIHGKTKAENLARVTLQRCKLPASQTYKMYQKHPKTASPQKFCKFWAIKKQSYSFISFIYLDQFLQQVPCTTSQMMTVPLARATASSCQRTGWKHTVNASVLCTRRVRKSSSTNAIEAESSGPNYIHFCFEMVHILWTSKDWSGSRERKSFQLVPASYILIPWAHALGQVAICLGTPISGRDTFHTETTFVRKAMARCRPSEAKVT